jgi:hypothetical protein
MAESKDSNIIDTILDLKRREPFDPFRIVMTSGDKYLIEAGENLIIGETQMFYAVPRSDKVLFIRMNQIAAVEQFDEKRPAKRRAS